MSSSISNPSTRITVWCLDSTCRKKTNKFTPVLKRPRHNCTEYTGKTYFSYLYSLTAQNMKGVDIHDGCFRDLIVKTCFLWQYYFFLRSDFSNFQMGKIKFRQCCGSGMFIPDPGSWFFFLPIPDPGSRISDPKTGRKERGEKIFFVKHFFLTTNFTKCKLI